MRLGFYLLVCTVVTMVCTKTLLARQNLQFDYTPQFHQDRFAIGFWVDPPLDSKADERYKRIAEAHFNLVIGGFGARSPEQVKRQLATCAKYDLKALVWAGKVPPEELPDGPACWGYLLQDEPKLKEFVGLASKVEAIRRARPGKLCYINLLPDYAGPGCGAPSYLDYVTSFVRQVHPDVLSMDHYPQFPPKGDGREDYCANLAVFSEVARAAHIPFWNFFLAMPLPDHPDPTEAQLRWQVNASLVYGAKGVLYFCYYTPRGPSFELGGALIDRNDQPTRHYYQAQRLNAELQRWGPWLMQLDNRSVQRLRLEKAQARVRLENSALLEAAIEPKDPAVELLVGDFTGPNGKHAVMLFNYDFCNTAWVTARFAVPAAQVLEVSRRTGKAEPVHDDSLARPGLQLSFEASEARLFFLPGGPAKE